MPQAFRISHPKEEGAFQASKWFSYRVLLDAFEMEDLFLSLPLFSLYNVSEIVSADEAIFSHRDFLDSYTSHIQALKKGVIETPPKAMFSSAMSSSSDVFYAMDVKKGVILKLLEPVIQLSIHHFTYSPESKAFHFMVHSKKSVSWGLQFSYPQLYANSVKGDVVEVMKDRSFPNTILFRALMKWMRNNSRPTPFIIEGRRVNVEARLGNQCFEWINEHPDLKEQNLMIERRGK